MENALKALGAVVLVVGTFVYWMVLIGLALWNHEPPTLASALLGVVFTQASALYIKMID